MKFLESLTITDYHLATTEVKRDFFSRCLNLQRYTPVLLLIETQERPFENMESILFRAAQNNGLKGATAIRAALDLPIKRSLNPKRRTQLSMSLRMNEEGLSACVPTVSSISGGTHAVELGGHSLRRDQLALSTSRMCPICVAKSGYGRSYWTIAPYAACEVHGVTLIDHCGVCGSPISASRPDFASCSCGASLRDAKSAGVSAGARRISHLIGARFRSSTADADNEQLGFPEAELNALSLSSLIDLVTFLGTLEPNAKIVRLRKLKGSMSIQVAGPRLERAARALGNWPMGFYAQLRRARSFLPRSESLDYVIRSLDHVMSLGIFSLHQEEFQFISTELGAFFAKPHEWNETRKHAHGGGRY